MHDYQKQILKMLRSGKRLQVFGGRMRNTKLKEAIANVHLHNIIKNMKVGQTLAVAGLDKIRVLRLEEVKDYSNCSKIEFK